VSRTADDRLDALSAWVARTLNDSRCTVQPASGDASFRRYFRVRTTTGESFIAMDAPPEKEDCRPYVRIARVFRGIGLNVPEILAQDLARGYLLVTDLGDRLYLDALSDDNVEALYRDAMRALLKLQCDASPDSAGLPLYDAELLHREMELFREWYLRRHLRLDLSPAQAAVLDEVFARLTACALEQPRVVVHRDYHSRNLLVTETNNPGILDFQDAVFGPVTYDLVSLLRDCYIAWPRERVEAWVRKYRDRAGRAGVSVGRDERCFLRWFDLMGVQRHLKASGIFARLHHRDGKPNYLKDIPRVLNYMHDVASRYPELDGLTALLRAIPAVDGDPSATSP
jgi:aminoglycoside/choline kinase family phosphotransferase